MTFAYNQMKLQLILQAFAFHFSGMVAIPNRKQINEDSRKKWLFDQKFLRIPPLQKDEENFVRIPPLQNPKIGLKGGVSLALPPDVFFSPRTQNTNFRIPPE